MPLLIIMSKLLEKCMSPALYDIKFLTRSQHGSVKNRSVITNILSFLTKNPKAIDENAENQLITFYNDFSKAEDKVPLYKLL